MSEQTDEQTLPPRACLPQPSHRLRSLKKPTTGICTGHKAGDGLPFGWLFFSTQQLRPVKHLAPFQTVHHAAKQVRLLLSSADSLVQDRVNIQYDSGTDWLLKMEIQDQKCVTRGKVVS